MKFKVFKEEDPEPSNSSSNIDLEVKKLHQRARSEDFSKSGPKPIKPHSAPSSPARRRLKTPSNIKESNKENWDPIKLVYSNSRTKKRSVLDEYRRPLTDITSLYQTEFSESNVENVVSQPEEVKEDRLAGSRVSSLKPAVQSGRFKLTQNIVEKNVILAESADNIIENKKATVTAANIESEK